MTDRLSPEARIALGIDDTLREHIVDQWETDINVSYQIEAMTELRAEILGEPYVEESDIYDSIWGRWDMGSNDAATRHMHVVRQMGGRALSVVDHGTLLFPSFQFKKKESFVPYPVVEAVNVILGHPYGDTTWGDIAWWRQPSGYLPDQSGESNRAPRDLLPRSQEHMKIIKIALANVFSD